MKRNFVPGMPHHIIVRGNNRRRIFSYKRDMERFVWDVGRALLATRALLHAMTLMSNHVHLIVMAHELAQLSAFVKKFAQRYAQYRNRTRDASGKLFEQRYFAEPIVSARQLAITTAYVELNAVRAGLVEHPLAYPWSTYAWHVDRPGESEIPSQLWTPTDWYQGLAGPPDVRAARYAAWVAECRARDVRPPRADEIAIIEALSLGDYEHRIERPDGMRSL